jgi:hypothetical protein
MRYEETEKMHPDNPDWPTEPLGILFMCDPRYAHLLSDEDKFERALQDAGERLFIPERFVLQ